MLAKRLNADGSNRPVLAKTAESKPSRLHYFSLRGHDGDDQGICRIMFIDLRISLILNNAACSQLKAQLLDWINAVGISLRNAVNQFCRATTPGATYKSIH